MNRYDLENELGRRAAAALQRTHLQLPAGDLRLALPLPLLTEDLAALTAYDCQPAVVAALHEHLLALGWHAHVSSDESVRELMALQLTELMTPVAAMSWPQSTAALILLLDLLHTACRHWDWLSARLRDELRERLAELATRVDPGAEPAGSGARLAAACARAAAGDLVHHDGAAGWHQQAAGELLRYLAATLSGFSEGIAGDIRALTPAAEWLRCAPADMAAEVWQHRACSSLVPSLVGACAPGAPLPYAAAENADLPRLLVTLQQQRPSPLSAWFLAACPATDFSAGALGAALLLDDCDTDALPPTVGLCSGSGAWTLRSGWTSDDLVLRILASNSPSAAVPCANGAVALAVGGSWLVPSPVVGDTGNAPVIDGARQCYKSARVVTVEQIASNLQHLSLELCGCYPQADWSQQLVRSIWLRGRGLVVIGDLLGSRPAKAAYSWLLPTAGVGLADNRATLVQGTTVAHLQVIGAAAKISLTPAAGGQLLQVSVSSADGSVWWVLTVNAPLPEVARRDQGKAIVIEGAEYRLA